MTWARYYRVCLDWPAALEAVERNISGLDDGHAVAVAELAAAVRGTGVSYDMVVGALQALADLAVLHCDGVKVFVINRAELVRSASARLAAQQAIRWAATRITDQAELLVAPARDWPEPTRASDKGSFSDLRAAIRAQIAEAERSILLASPFWDLEVAQDLGEILQRRLEAGVRLRILAREPIAGSPSATALRRLSGLSVGGSAAEVLILDKRSAVDRFGSSTFHFKAALFDAEIAYLGSANFNTAGFGSRWELGVLLRGNQARRVSALLEWLLAFARPLT